MKFTKLVILLCLIVLSYSLEKIGNEYTLLTYKLKSQENRDTITSDLSATDNDVTTTTQANPTTTQANPTTTQANPTPTQANPTTTQANPTTTQANPTTTQANPTTTQANPTTTQANPTTTQANPTTTQANPTTTQANPTTTQANPTTTQANPTTTQNSGVISNPTILNPSPTTQNNQGNTQAPSQTSIPQENLAQSIPDLAIFKDNKLNNNPQKDNILTSAAIRYFLLQLKYIDGIITPCLANLDTLTKKAILNIFNGLGSKKLNPSEVNIPKEFNCKDLSDLQNKAKASENQQIIEKAYNDILKNRRRFKKI